MEIRWPGPHSSTSCASKRPRITTTSPGRYLIRSRRRRMYNEPPTLNRPKVTMVAHDVKGSCLSACSGVIRLNIIARPSILSGSMAESALTRGLSSQTASCNLHKAEYCWGSMCDKIVLTPWLRMSIWLTTLIEAENCLPERMKSWEMVGSSF
jgi:hypothetical protein